MRGKYLELKRRDPYLVSIDCIPSLKKKKEFSFIANMSINIVFPLRNPLRRMPLAVILDSLHSNLEIFFFC